MSKVIGFVVLGLLAPGCGIDQGPANSAKGPNATATVSLSEARKNFRTRVGNPTSPGTPAPEPPPQAFRKVRYKSPVGELSAYLTPDRSDGTRHPAIVWITGGDCNSIGDVWTPAPRADDQTASAYRMAGIVLMFPSLRGGNDNPGKKEYFLGEIDDVLAATDYLAAQPYVDKNRIYLGGHSTGGTLALLVAESSNRYRAVFSFGPTDDVSNYPPEYRAFDAANIREALIRSPGRWLHSLQSPLFVFEGTDQANNIPALQTMAAAANKNPLAHFYAVKGASHFSILAPTNERIAAKIVADDSPALNIRFTEAELNDDFARGTSAK
jgi:dienelactone hydrolase